MLASSFEISREQFCSLRGRERDAAKAVRQISHHRRAREEIQKIFFMCEVWTLSHHARNDLLDS
jgi:hypothetical protein